MSEFCKVCGREYRDLRTLLNSSCTCHTPGPGRCVPFEGDKNGPLYCVHCGRTFPSLRTMATVGTCFSNHNHPHEPFEGDVTGDFTCKYCGRTFRSMRDMVINTCNHASERGGHHSPAR